jgi:hypothetical protein
MVRLILVVVLAACVVLWLLRRSGGAAGARRAAQPGDPRLLARRLGLAYSESSGQWRMEGLLAGFRVKLRSEQRPGYLEADSLVVIEVCRPGAAPGGSDAEKSGVRRALQGRAATAPSFDLASGCWVSELWTSHGLDPAELEAALTETLAAAGARPGR